MTFLWVRSYWCYDEYSFSRQLRVHNAGEYLNAGIVSERGQLVVNYQWYISQIANDSKWLEEAPVMRQRSWTVMPAVAGRYDSLKPRLGFKTDAIVRPDLVSRVFLFPHWFVFTLSAVLPMFTVMRLRRRRKRDPSLCKICGYDLRATPDRCPECGAVPDRSPAASA